MSNPAHLRGIRRTLPPLLGPPALWAVPASLGKITNNERVFSIYRHTQAEDNQHRLLLVAVFAQGTQSDEGVIDGVVHLVEFNLEFVHKFVQTGGKHF